MAYQELIKNFTRIREYMRQFYVYGFKSRQDFEHKSNRTYDNEKRRIESYLEDNIAFHQTITGKHVFLSIDSRKIDHNPFYKTFKVKSFTNTDITLHFYLLDIMHNTSVECNIQEIMEAIDVYLFPFQNPTLYDISTVRKKLKEYVDLGLLISRKIGKQQHYRRSSDPNLHSLQDLISFFSEADMQGIIGSYLLDRQPSELFFTFKHHYLTQVLESEVLYDLLRAIQEHREIRLFHLSQKRTKEQEIICVPLKIFVSTQHGRQYLMAFDCRMRNIKSYRLDYSKKIEMRSRREDYEHLRALLDTMRDHMWGIRCSLFQKQLEHVEFCITFRENESYIYQRLIRERRCGSIERLDVTTARFVAEVYDTEELIPWIRSFTGRITRLNFSNRTIENQLKADFNAMYVLYGIGGSNDALS